MPSGKQVALNAIRDHYLNGTDLTTKHEEIRQRWVAAFAMLCNFHSIQQAVPLLSNQFDISDATVYRDISNAVKLFGDVLKSSKDGYRWIVYEYCVKTFQLAAKHGDHKAMNMANSNMIKVLGLDRDDPDTPDFSKLQPSMVVTVLADGMETQLQKLLQGGAVNLNNFAAIETIPFEDADSEAE